MDGGELPTFRRPMRPSKYFDRRRKQKIGEWRPKQYLVPPHKSFSALNPFLTSGSEKTVPPSPSTESTTTILLPALDDLPISNSANFSEDSTESDLPIKGLPEENILALDPVDMERGKDFGRLVGRKLNDTMLHSLTILTLLRLLSDAKLTCQRGYVTHERIPGHKLVGFQETMIRDVVDPAEFVQNCMNWCNNGTDPDNETSACGFFNFESGKSRARLSEASDYHRWHESKCYFAKIGVYDGLDHDVNLVKDPDFDHFSEICLKKETGNVIKANCPNRLYAFNRYPGLKFRPPKSKDVSVQSREECQDRCLSEPEFVCRAAAFESSTLMCYMSDVSVESYPIFASKDDDYDYLENVCLNGETRCKGILRFITEKSRELTNPNDAMVLENVSMEQCRRLCRDDNGFLPFYCKAYHYEMSTELCLLTDRNSFELPSGSGNMVAKNARFSYHEGVCIQGGNVNGTDNEVSGIQEGIYTNDWGHEPFQLLRNSKLEAEPYVVYQDYDVGRCLDECLHRDQFLCLSVGYNPYTGECRLSRFDESSARLVFDPNFNYYRNIEVDQDGRLYYAGYEGAYRPRKSNANGNGGFNYGPPVVLPSARPPFKPLPPTPRPRPPSRRPSVDQPPFMSYPDTVDTTPPNQIPQVVTTRHSNSVIQKDVRYSNCDDNEDNFRQVRSRTRLKTEYVRKSDTVSSLYECEQLCLREDEFNCQSFNFIFTPTLSANCELSDSLYLNLDVNNPAQFDHSENHDFYARQSRKLYPDPCIDVTQSCSENGMEFTLRTPVGFRGRIYTYKHFNRPGCSLLGDGGRVHVLRIPGPNGIPNCGTESYGNTQTNIVVVQHSDIVQTSRDVIYNLTCTVQPPADSVVSSGYIGAGSGQPVPIEYLPAEHTLDSEVKLVIEYLGRPTTTIAVGDELTFKLETQDGLNLVRDIFATNVIAKDPYSSRTIELIDRNGCPVDPSVFPALGLSRSGDGLVSNFNAFKIPESNFLVFEANVRSCHGPCEPASCSGIQGRSLSFGRKKREVPSEGHYSSESGEMSLREMFRVYESRDEITEEDYEIGATSSSTSGTSRDFQICLTASEYYGFVAAILALVMLLVVLAALAGCCCRRASRLSDKPCGGDLKSAASSVEQFKSQFIQSPINLPNVVQLRPRQLTNRAPPTNHQPFTYLQNNVHLERRGGAGRRSYYLPEPSQNNASNSSTDESSMETLDNPIANASGTPRTIDPSEPIFTNPDLFEQNTTFNHRC